MSKRKLKSIMVLLLTLVMICIPFVQADNVNYLIISEPQWDEVRPFSEGMAAVKKVVVTKTADGEDQENELWGFINSSGKIVIEPKYQLVGDFHEGLAYAFNIEKDCMEFIDKQGKVAIDGKKLLDAQYAAKGLENKWARYYGAVNCSGGIIGFENDATLTIDYYDIKGNPIVSSDENVDSAYGFPFSEGVGCIQIGPMGKVGFIDKAGKVTYINNGKQGEIRPFNQGLAFAAVYVEQKSADGNIDMIAKWGIIDKTGKYVVQPQYEDFLVNDMNTWQSFNDGLAVVKKAGKWGAIDKSGKTVIKHNYSYLSVIYSGMAAYKIADNGKYGIIDKTGKIITKPVFDKFAYSRDGLMAVQKAGKWGYIDAKGKEIIKAVYDDCSATLNGTAFVKLGKEYFWIDKNGKKLAVLKEKIDGFTGIYEGGYIITRLNNKMGFIKLK